MLRFLYLLTLANGAASMSSQAVRRTASLNLTAAFEEFDMTVEAAIKQLKVTAKENECVMDTLSLHDNDELLTTGEEYYAFVETSELSEKNSNWSLDSKGVPKAETLEDFTNTFSDPSFKAYEQSCFSSGGMMCYFNIFLKGEISIRSLTNIGVNLNFTAIPACTSKTCTGVDVSSLSDVGLPQAFAEKLGLSLDNLDFHVDVDKCDY